MKPPLPALFFVAALALRLPVLLAHLDTWYVFEVHGGTIARALLDGLDLDWATLPIISHVRGNVVEALLLAPIYAAFGASSLTLKLVPLLWHAATVALLVHLLARHAGRFAAVAAGAFMLLGPPVVQKLSVLGLASHQESMLPFLLALWPWLHMTAARRFGAAPAFALGAASGFAAFYHVQALLPCLVLLGLLLASEAPALFPKGLLALAAGFALGASPSLAFEGGSLQVIQASLEAGAGRAEAEDLGVDPGAPTHDPLAKLGGLVCGDFARSLEFAEVPGPAAPFLGATVALLMAALPLLAAWLERRRLADLALRVFRRRTGLPPGPVPPLLLHASLMLAMFAVSHSLMRPVLTTGATNRHMAPLWFSLIALSGLGLGALADRGRRGLALALLAVALLPGAAGAVALSQAPTAARLLQRGECYEWFRTQLVHASGGRDSPATVELIRRIDRGDPRFRNLRYKLQLTRTPLDDPRLLDAERRLVRGLDPELGVLALTSLGRQLGAQLDAARPGARITPRLRDPDVLAALNELSPGERAALLHGVGLAIEPPRPGTAAAAAEGFEQRLVELFRSLQAAHAVRVAEGWGFRVGFNYDGYSEQARELVPTPGLLDDAIMDALYVGLGWGFRQRYLEPPTEVPDGLVVLERVPPAHRAAFVRGYTGAVLPAEAPAAR